MMQACCDEDESISDVQDVEVTDEDLPESPNKNESTSKISMSYNTECA